MCDWHSKCFTTCACSLVCCHKHHCVLKFIITTLGAKNIELWERKKNMKRPDTDERVGGGNN